MEETLPPGFRFHPTDEELITHYLTHKVSDFSFTSKAIVDVDLNKSEPWDLPAKASMGEKEWYFFSLRDRKYPTGLRTNRATEAGYWKTTGKDKEIFRGGVLVGMKKTLVFYRGRAPKGEKTNWVMHEYRLETNLSFKPTKEEWVVCRVFQKSSAVKKPQQTSPSQPSMDSPCDDTNIMANEFGDIDLANMSSIVNSSSAMSNVNLNASTNTMSNLNMNWPAATDQAAANGSGPFASAPLPWPPSLLGSNLSVNALLLRALQLRSSAYNQPREAANADYSPFMAPQAISHQLGSDFGSNNNNSVQQQQPQEQPFNLDSIW